MMTTTHGSAGSLLSSNELSSFGSFLDGLGGDDNLERATRSLISALPSESQPLPEEWAGMTHDELRSIISDAAQEQRRLRQLDSSMASGSGAGAPPSPTTKLSHDILAALDRQHSASTQQHHQQQQQHARPAMYSMQQGSTGSFGSGSGSSSFSHSSGSGTSSSTATATQSSFNLLASPPRHSLSALPPPRYPNAEGNGASLNLAQSPLGLSGSAPLPPSAQTMGPAQAFATGWGAQPQLPAYGSQSSGGHHQYPMSSPSTNRFGLGLFNTPTPTSSSATSDVGALIAGVPLPQSAYPPGMPLPAAGDGYLSNDADIERKAAELMDGPSGQIVPGTSAEARRPARETRKRASDASLPTPAPKRTKSSHESTPPASVPAKKAAPGSKTGQAKDSKAAKGKKAAPAKPALTEEVSATAAGVKPRAALLSATQKKQNHIQSEQKRRANIRRGYDALCSVVPALRDAGGALDPGASAADKDKARSEGLVLVKTIEHINALLARQAQLHQRLIAARSIRPNSHSSLAEPKWERRWDGGRGVMVGPDGEELEPDMDDGSDDEE